MKGTLHRLRVEAHALWLAARDPATPTAAKIVAFLVAAYALSPIDLIPDFVPVLGLLDDLVIVPAGVWLVRRMIPPALHARHLAEAEAAAARPVSRGGIAIVVALWLIAALLAWRLVSLWAYW